MELSEFVDNLWSTAQWGKNLERAEEYLATRGLRLFSDVGYVNLFQFGEKILSGCLVFFIRDVIGNFVGVDTRSIQEKSFDSVWQDSNSIPLYGIGRVFGAKMVFLTESVLDAESLNQLGIEGACSVSLRTSSLNLAKAYYLGALLSEKDVYMAFDNDESGVKGAQAYQDFFRDKFGKQVSFLDFPYKDINSFLVKRGSGFVRKHIVDQFL